MVNESSQPKPGDAVLGGNNPPPIGAAVLGGIERVKQRCASLDFQTRIGGLREALKHGKAGIELLLHGLKDEVLEVALLAYSLLQENVEPELKRVLEIYDPYPRKCIRTLTDTSSPYGFSDIAFSPNGKLLASLSNGFIKLWDVKTGRLINNFCGEIRTNNMTFSPNWQLLATSTDSIKLWNVKTGKLKTDLSESYESRRSHIRSIAFSPNGQLLASASEDNVLRLWDVDTGTLKTTLPDSLVGDSIAFSPDGKILASGHYNAIKLWEVETGTLKTTFSWHTGDVACPITFSPNGQLIADCGGTIRLWDVETGTLKTTLPANIRTMAFSPNGQLVASAPPYDGIKVCDVETGTFKIALPSHSHTDLVSSVVFSPNGQLLASASRDKTIKLWEAEISNLNVVDPVALFRSYLEIKQPQNSSLYEAIQILARGTEAEKKVAFLQLKDRVYPVVTAALWSYIHALKPHITPDYESLKYLLAIDRWQEAKQESEKILLLKLGRKEVNAINEKSSIDTLETIFYLWQLYATNSSLIEEKEPLGFFTDLQTKVRVLNMAYPFHRPRSTDPDHW